MAHKYPQPDEFGNRGVRETPTPAIRAILDNLYSAEKRNAKRFLAGEDIRAPQKGNGGSIADQEHLGNALIQIFERESLRPEERG